MSTPGDCRRGSGLLEWVRRLFARRRPRLELTPLDPPDAEPAPVRCGPPRRPPPSSAVALSLPQPPLDVDAYAAG